MGSVVQNMSHGTWFTVLPKAYTVLFALCVIILYITLELSEIDIQQLKNIYYAGQCVAWFSLSCRLDPVTVVLCEVEFPNCHNVIWMSIFAIFNILIIFMRSSTSR